MCTACHNTFLPTPTCTPTVHRCVRRAQRLRSNSRLGHFRVGSASLAPPRSPGSTLEGGATRRLRRLECQPLRDLPTRDFRILFVCCRFVSFACAGLAAAPWPTSLRRPQMQKTPKSESRPQNLESPGFTSPAPSPQVRERRADPERRERRAQSAGSQGEASTWPASGGGGEERGGRGRGGGGGGRERDTFDQVPEMRNGIPLVHERCTHIFYSFITANGGDQEPGRGEGGYADVQTHTDMP